MSKLCDQVIDCLRQVFPEVKIYVEKAIKVDNHNLFIDIWIPQLNLAIEVHGRQHEQFVEYFHGTAENFMNYKRRDRLKAEWITNQGYNLLILLEKDLPILPNKLLEKINEVQCNE